MSEYTDGPPGIAEVIVVAKCPTCGTFHKCKRGNVKQANGLFLHMCSECVSLTVDLLSDCAFVEEYSFADDEPWGRIGK